MQFSRVSVALFLLGGLILSHPGVVHAQLRAGADRRGFFVGASLDMEPFRNESVYRETARREFNLLVGGNAFKWDNVRPARNTFNYRDTDELVNFALANNMRVRGHTLVWHNQIPGWLTSGNFTREQVIEFLREHIISFVGRYRGMVWAWDVVNEAVSDSGGLRTDSFWYQKIGPDYIRLAFEFARQADPDARLYYNDYSAEGLGAKSDAVYNLVRDLKSQGVPIDGVGWQTHWLNGFRIEAQHQTNARRLAALGLEISITELDVRISQPTTSAKLTQQAQSYRDVINFCLTEPNCKALVTWGFTDKYSWIPTFFPGWDDALIFDRNYQTKPAYVALREVLDGAPLPSPPPAPAGLTATPGNAQVTLRWNAATRATSYNVKRSTATGGPYTTIANGLTATSFTNTGLANNTTYFYIVSAVNSAGESPNSTPVRAIPQATPPAPPAIPTGLAATAGNAQVTLHWSFAPGATSYHIKRSTASGGPFATIANVVTSTSFTNTGLVNGTTYFYVVSGVNPSGESPNSAPASATPQAPVQGACTVAYRVTNQWASGFQGEVTVTNHGAPLNGWTLSWAFPSTQAITQLWNGSVTQTGVNVSVRNLSWNGALTTGGSASFGFLANRGATNPLPAAFRLNNVLCTTR